MSAKVLPRYRCFYLKAVSGKRSKTDYLPALALSFPPSFLSSPLLLPSSFLLQWLTHVSRDKVKWPQEPRPVSRGPTLCQPTCPNHSTSPSRRRGPLSAPPAALGFCHSAFTLRGHISFRWNHLKIEPPTKAVIAG